MDSPLVITLGTLGAVASGRSARALLDALPGAEHLAEQFTHIQAETLCLQPNAALDFKLLLRVMLWARERIAAGAGAVILVMEGDSLEECGYFFDLLWDLDAPLLLTDGADNLSACVTAALDPDSGHRGALIVIAEQIHSAVHFGALIAAREAPLSATPLGPVGVVQAGRCRYFRPPPLRFALAMPVFIEHRVALLEACLCADTDLLEQTVALQYSGLVVAAQGDGQVSAPWARGLERVADEIPVVIAARNGPQGVPQGVSQRGDQKNPLAARGLLSAGCLSARKARVRLWLLIAAGADVREEFAGSFR